MRYLASVRQRHIQNGVAWLNEDQKLAESPEDQRLMRYKNGVVWFSDNQRHGVRLFKTLCFSHQKHGDAQIRGMKASFQNVVVLNKWLAEAR